MNVSDTNITVEIHELGYLIPKYYIQVEDSLDVTVSVYGATVPDTSALFPTGISQARISSKLLSSKKSFKV